MAAMQDPGERPVLTRVPALSRARWQTILFVVSTAGAGLLGVAAQALVARELGVDEFAIYAFALAVLQFAATFFEFGLFIPAARQAALADPHERTAIVGTALAAYLPVAVGFSALIFVISLVVDPIVDFDAGPTLMLAAIGAFTFPFMLIGQALAQGTERLHVFSLAHLGWQAVFATALALLALAGVGYGSGEAVLLREASMAAGVALIAVWLRPRIDDLRRRLGSLVSDARAWGRSVYVGRVLSTSTYNMDTLLVGLFAGAEEVAFYSLAKLLAYSISLPATGASGALFVRMASAPRIHRRWLEFAWLVGLGGAAVLAAVASPLIDLAYGDEFADAAVLVLPLAVAEAIRGVGAVYNGFLNAHAQGRAIRRAAIVFTVTNLITNFTLIPLFGGSGAAVASAIAMTASLLTCIYGYRRMSRAGATA
jgi:O-antigen/teichoic acid export membrane protein